MSKTTSPKALLALLNGHPQLAALRKSASTQAPQPANSDPMAVLPPALRERVTLIKEAHRWLAITENNATAQLLRFHLPRLQQALLGEQVKIVVGGKRQAQATHTVSSRHHPVLSEHSAAHIRDLAASIDDDDLSDALLRLASRSED